MSKLQKAIQRLSQGKPLGLDTDPKDSSRTAVRRRPKATFVEVRDGVSLQDEEPLSHHVTISQEAREQSGLEPMRGYEDQLARQFGRIKRPIMVNAFDLTGLATENANVIMIASAMPETGKTFSTLNLARSISQERDFGALLVDADVLNPRVTRALELDQRPGLIDYLLNDSMSLDDVLVQTDCDGIIVLPAGGQHRDATELLASKRMRELVRLLAKRFQSRAILFDTPPLLMTNEAVVLSKYMGQIALVIEAGKTPVEAIDAALALLDREKPINAILNKVRDASDDTYGGGYYSYGAAAAEEERSGAV